jgi:hypothetical protein
MVLVAVGIVLVLVGYGTIKLAQPHTQGVRS